MLNKKAFDLAVITAMGVPSLQTIRELQAQPSSKNCKECSHRQIGGASIAHCYMFEKEPAGDVCGQFKARTS